VIEDHIVIVERNDAWHLLVEGAEGGIFRQHRAINVNQHLLFFRHSGVHSRNPLRTLVD